VSPPIFLLVGVFLAVAIGGPIVAVRHLDAAATAEFRITNAQEDLESLLRAQLDEESSVRTGDPVAATYEPDPAVYDPTFAALTTLSRGLIGAQIDDAVNLIDDIRSAHQRWELSARSPLKKSDPLAARRRLTESKLEIDRFTADVSALRTRLKVEDQRVQAVLKRRINTTVAISAGLITLFAIWALMLAISRASAVAALDKEHAIVTTLQRALRAEASSLDRTEIGTTYISATREALIGGDLLDTWRLDADRGYILIADVSGKGIDAAVDGAFVQFALRTLATDGDDPAVILTRFNRLFAATITNPSTFVVLFLGLLDTRAMSLRYASAGHSAAFIRRADRIESLDVTGPIVGIGPNELYTANTVSLAENETILLATDGLTESRDAAGDLLGEDGVRELFAEASDDPQGICDSLVAEIRQRSGGTIGDDLAIIAIKLAPIASNSARLPA